MTDKKDKDLSINQKAAREDHEKKKTNPDAVNKAKEEAEKDLVEDAEFTAHNKNDDLDESESLNLGEDKTGLV
jgi:hypothetical protein